MNKFYKINIAALLITAILVIAFMCVFPRSSGVSATETRVLTEFPAFSVENYLSGEYTATITEWFTDTIPYRDFFLDLASEIRGFYGIDYKIKTEDGKEIHFESNGVQEGIKDERPEGNVSDPLAGEDFFETPQGENQSSQKFFEENENVNIID